MQTRPFPSSVPVIVEMNGTAPMRFPCPHVPARHRLPIGRCPITGASWDRVGYYGNLWPVNKKPRKSRGLVLLHRLQSMGLIGRVLLGVAILRTKHQRIQGVIGMVNKVLTRLYYFCSSLPETRT